MLKYGHIIQYICILAAVIKQQRVSSSYATHGCDRTHRKQKKMINCDVTFEAN